MTRKTKRPSKASAEAAIESFLTEEGLGTASFSLVEDGDGDDKAGWAFWIRPDDTTSYLHPDLTVEWYGTIWEEGTDRFDEDEDDTEKED